MEWPTKASAAVPNSDSEPVLTAASTFLYEQEELHRWAAIDDKFDLTTILQSILNLQSFLV